MTMSDLHVERIGESKFVDVVAGREDEALELHRQDPEAFLVVNHARGYKDTTLEPLLRSAAKKRVPIRGLSVSGVFEDFSIVGLEDLTDLEMLCLSGPAGVPDYAAFPKLLELRARLDKRGLPSLPRLEVAWLEGYRSPDARALLTAPRLRDLTLTRPLISTLEGIEGLRRLEKLMIYAATRLRQISSLSQLEVFEELELDACKKVEDIDAMRSSSLKRLILSNCGSVASLKFVSNMPALSTFTFVGTKVEDGDLTPILHIESIGFDDKRHYSHRYADLERARQRTEQ